MIPDLLLAPSRLWLLLLVVPVVALAAWAARRRRTSLVRFTGMDLLDEVAPRPPTWPRWLVTGLFVAGLVVGTAALAQPAVVEVVTETVRGRIMVVIDTSYSMEATDVDPSRLEAAQAEAIAFVEGVDPGIEVGLVSFNGTVSRDVDLTTDHADVVAGIEGLELGPSTAVGDGVLAAVDQLAASSDAGSEAFPGAVVLLSDGETTVGSPPDQAADEASEAGIPVFTIAFGTADGVIRDPLTDQLVRVPVAEDELAAIAEATGATFTAAGSAAGLQDAYDQIAGQLQELIGEPESVEVEITWRWVALALALLLAAFLASQWWLRGVL